jgi:hypothetical protein
MEHLIEVNCGVQSFSNLIKKQKENRTFADETFITYTAVYLGIAIRILKIENESVREEIFPASLAQPSATDRTCNLCIAHYNDHFQSVVDEETLLSVIV